MRAIMEPLFEVCYLSGVIVLGILILLKAKGRLRFVLFGIMSIVLGSGDAFHLVPRIYALLTDGLANHAAALGFGKLVTSITMTVFYVLLYHVWRERYAQRRPGLSVTVYGLAALRIGLCLFPQNDWLSPSAPLRWGIYRNIPFTALGIIIIVLYLRGIRQNQDRAFRWMWLAVTLSFAFYLPVVLGADKAPVLGMLMIPKTCAYLWIVWMGYADAVKSPLPYPTGAPSD